MMKSVFNRKNILYLFLTIFLIVITSILMNSSFYDMIITFDKKIISSVSYIVNTYYTNFFSILTNFGDWYIPIVIIVCILLFIKNKTYFYILASGYVFSGLIVFVSKMLTQRPRPNFALIEIPKSFSFPSGHTLTSIVFYITLWYLLTYKSNKKVKILTFILTIVLVLLIGVSRIYLGVHYFSDVIGGIILSIPILTIIFNITKKVLR